MTQKSHDETWLFQISRHSDSVEDQATRVNESLRYS